MGKIEELLTFVEAFAAVMEGKRIDIYPHENWSYYQADSLGTGSATLVDQEGVEWWPNLEQTKGMWHVEPEESKEIFVWGVYDKSGLNRFFTECPTLDDDGYWNVLKSNLDMFPPNIFPKDKPQKFRLVPADQPAGITWKKFDADKMPEKEFKFLALMMNGEIYTDTWGHHLNRWGIWDLVPGHIKYYYPVSEIPRPEPEDE